MLGGRGLQPAEQSLSWEQHTCPQKKSGFWVRAVDCPPWSRGTVWVVAARKNFIVIFFFFPLVQNTNTVAQGRSPWSCHGPGMGEGVLRMGLKHCASAAVTRDRNSRAALGPMDRFSPR